MIFVGAPNIHPNLSQIDEVTGGSPYGAGTLYGDDGAHQPSEKELEIARFQGRDVAEITRKLKLGG